MKRLALLFALVLAPWLAYAQVNPVTTIPSARSADSTNSSTIAVTNTFQTVFTANANRTGCTIQNNSARTMYVYFVPIAGTAATTAASAVLAAGQALNCSVFGTSLTNSVQITGTATDVFYAAVW